MIDTSLVKLLHECHGGDGCERVAPVTCPACRSTLSGYTIPKGGHKVACGEKEAAICCACKTFLWRAPGGALLEMSMDDVAALDDAVRLTLVAARRALSEP